MFLTDVLRHTGAARSAEFVGPTDANIAMDRGAAAQRRSTPASEAAAQIEDLAERFGAEGDRLVAALDAYIAGINAAQDAMCPARPARSAAGCPAEYAALQEARTPWTRADIVYVASLVGGIFGKGGGGEYANAIWLQQLQEKFGTQGRQARVRRPAREERPRGADDGRRPPFPYGGGPGIHPAGPASRCPTCTARPRPAPAPTSARRPPAPRPAAAPRPATAAGMLLDRRSATLDLTSVGPGMSNALLVDAAALGDRPPARGLRAADRLLRAAAADRAGAARARASRPAASPSPAPTSS